MSDVAKTYRLFFRHDVIEGSPYEAGRWQGQQLAEDAWRGGFTGRPPFLKNYTPEEAKKALRIVERYCPGIAEEIRGASETSGIPIEQMTFLGGCLVKGGKRIPTLWADDDASPEHATAGGCSHFYLPRKLNPDGHIRLGCNYDCHPEMQELRLCTTRIDGKLTHISFSDTVFGRVNGLNEHGFGITSSLGSPLSQVQVAGFPYFIVSRILLDQCRSVPEALDLLETLPIAWYSNYILADSTGETALVEIACSERAIRRFKPDEAPSLWATNHYTLSEMDGYASLCMQQSVSRWEFLRGQLENTSTPIARPHELLAAPYPDGLLLSHYFDGLGTLNSMILDLDTLTADVCFGPQSLNPWNTFGLDSPSGSTLYEAEISNLPAPPGFWKRVGSG